VTERPPGTFGSAGLPAVEGVRRCDSVAGTRAFRPGDAIDFVSTGAARRRTIMKGVSTEQLSIGTIDSRVSVRARGPTQVAFLHAAPFLCWYEPLLDRLADDISWLRYERDIGEGPFGLADDADAVLTMLAHVGFEHVHMVGHSYGGLVALEIARRGPRAVRSLALLEPAASGFLDPKQAMAVMAPLMEVVDQQGATAAMELFLGIVLGDDAASLARHVPDGPAQAAARADQFFRAELPAVTHWSYGADHAAAVSQPVINVVGERSVERFRTTADLLQSWWPHAERFDVPGAGHLLMAQQPELVAERLQVFWR
jgi:pimeloyl-ACP methyl ester carboxylesterase